MSSGLAATNPTIVSAFKAALLHQGLVVLVLLALLAVAWRVLRLLELRRALAAGPAVERSELVVALPAEAPARRLLRIGFGLVWIFDGILQGQPAMPLGMGPEVIRPTAAASPAWVQHLVNAGATIWNYHPIAASASAVWIQAGIGLLLLVAPRGSWSRLAGAAACTWALLVWVFGESFGGIFAPGLTWLFGAPGAALLYAVAGALVALPERSWATLRPGRAVLAAMGAFFLAMALLQAWPGRGFWQGRLPHHEAGTLVAMIRQMATTPQPHVLSSWLSAFAAFTAAHGFGVNAFAVAVLALLGTAFLVVAAFPARLGLARLAVATACVLCLADWLLVEDLGFFGGVGTDPNSMIPIALVLVAGYLGIARVALPAPSPAAVPAGAGSRRAAGWVAALARRPTYFFRLLAALAALGVVLLGAVPMAVASIEPNADPIIAAATDGRPSTTDFPAPPFRLVDQAGRTVSLSGLRGKIVALTFLDPVCTSDCPIIAQELRQADRLVGRLSRRVELVAIDANPLFLADDYLAAFDRQEGLGRVRNWRYLTGSLATLRRVWSDYGVQVDYSPGGAMVAHSELAYVIGPDGDVRSALDADPGPGTPAAQSSFAVTLAQVLERVASPR